MAIELLDMKKTWAKIKSGFSGGPFFRSPGRNVKPTGYKSGIETSVMDAQQRPQTTGANAFTGKTYNQRKN